MDKDPSRKQEQLDVRVRLATPQDWRMCKAMRSLAYIDPKISRMMGLTPERIKEEENKTDAEWQAEASSGKMFSVLAFVNASVAGLGRTKEVNEKIWRVRNGYVKPEFERMGIQTKMIALRLREIIRRGGVKAVTGIRTDNTVSIHNAEKFGFKTIETEEGWNHMELDLTDPEVIKKINEILNATDKS